MAIMENLVYLKAGMDSRKSCESYKSWKSFPGKKGKDTNAIPFRDSNEKARNPNRKQAWQGRWPRAPLLIENLFCRESLNQSIFQ